MKTELFHEDKVQKNMKKFTFAFATLWTRFFMEITRDKELIV